MPHSDAICPLGPKGSGKPGQSALAGTVNRHARRPLGSHRPKQGNATGLTRKSRIESVQKADHATEINGHGLGKRCLVLALQLTIETRSGSQNDAIS